MPDWNRYKKFEPYTKRAQNITYLIFPAQVKRDPEFGAS